MKTTQRTVDHRPHRLFHAPRSSAVAFSLLALVTAFAVINRYSQPLRADVASDEAQVSDSSTLSIDDDQGRPLGDMDGNSRTNLDDFAGFNDCLLNSGPAAETAAGGCEYADFDGDSDVDLADMAGFQQAVTHRFVVFSDPNSSFQTVDVNDVENQIVRFDPFTNAIVWAATDTQYSTGSWPTNGNSLGWGGSFTVRFGTQNGQRRAFFTETGPATICDIQINGPYLYIYATSTPVPQE